MIASGLLLLQAAAWVGLLAAVDAARDALPAGALVWIPLAVGLGLALPVMQMAVRASGRHEWSA